MSELTITLLRLGYLVLLWVFVLSTIAVLRRDLYGTKITNRRAARPRAAAPGPTPAPSGRPAPPPKRDSTARRLVVTEGPLRGTTIPLTTSAVLIGRAPSCTLVLDDDYSSSRHARIFPQDGGWFVEDLGSTNGTYIGSQRITSPVPVAIGTSVRLGKTIVELRK